MGRSMGQLRVHERLMQRAGVRIDRAGGALLYMLRAHGESARVTELAELLGVDSPLSPGRSSSLSGTASWLARQMPRTIARHGSH